MSKMASQVSSKTNRSQDICKIPNQSVVEHSASSESTHSCQFRGLVSHSSAERALSRDSLVDFKLAQVLPFALSAFVHQPWIQQLSIEMSVRLTTWQCGGTLQATTLAYCRTLTYRPPSVKDGILLCFCTRDSPASTSMSIATGFPSLASLSASSSIFRALTRVSSALALASWSKAASSCCNNGFCALLNFQCDSPCVASNVLVVFCWVMASSLAFLGSLDRLWRPASDKADQ